MAGLASLDGLVNSRFNETHCLKKIMWRTEEDMRHFWPSAPQVSACMHTYVPLHTCHTNEHTHTHMNYIFPGPSLQIVTVKI